MPQTQQPLPYALILCSGPVPGRRQLAPLAAKAARIVCADGGADRALQRGLQPDVIIGDMDSVSPAARASFVRAQWIQVQDQESNDLEKALEFVIAQGMGAAIVAGATGRRADHTLANFSILARYHDRIQLQFVDDHCRMRILSGETSLPLPVGRTLSLMPLGRCEGITTAGLAYPLHDESLELGVREGLSNRVISSPVRITVRRGHLLLFEVVRP